MYLQNPAANERYESVCVMLTTLRVACTQRVSCFICRRKGCSVGVIVRPRQPEVIGLVCRSGLPVAAIPWEQGRVVALKYQQNAYLNRQQDAQEDQSR